MLASQTPLRPYTTGSATLTTTLTYLSGANGSKTGMIASYRNGTDDAYTYTYDANGNIVSITKGSLSFTYTYDAANQLIREDLYYGSGNSNNATYTYEYDAWGNILNKKEYAYTTGTLGTAINTVSYGYTDSQWGDLLTSYNGQSISYDAMGNITSYGNKTYTWEGKQLVGINVMGMIQYSFAYDENGLRTRKTVTFPTMGTEEITEYYYNGTVLIGMKIGTGSTAKVLRFSYDASGNVVAVDYSEDGGTNYTTYYYLRNAQNDIVKLIDGSGNTVVEYTYDSWGKIISSTGTLANTVGTYQPFRYRGYVYDEETQLYYLQSRYYDPNNCRFISADVLLSTGQGVLGHNAFAYCLNDPICRSDEDGNYSEAFSWHERRLEGQGTGSFGIGGYGGGGGSLIAGLLELLSKVDFSEGIIDTTKAIGAVAAAIIAALDIDNELKRENYVYLLRNSQGEVVYVGRTKDPDRRKAEHDLNPFRTGLTMYIVAKNLTLPEARVVEQACIFYYKTLKKRIQPFNQINSLNPIYWSTAYWIEIAEGTLDYTWNNVSNEILYWLENL